MVSRNADLRNDRWTAAVLRSEQAHHVQPDPHGAAQQVLVHVAGDILCRIARSPFTHAYDICLRFLDRNPETRLGTMSFEDICNHPWFASIDWEKLFNKQVVPPFKPVVKGAEDVENVDSEFLQELPTVTPTFEGRALTDPAAFEGFSYNPNQMYNN